MSNKNVAVTQFDYYNNMLKQIYYIHKLKYFMRYQVNYYMSHVTMLSQHNFFFVVLFWFDCFQHDEELCSRIFSFLKIIKLFFFSEWHLSLLGFRAFY